jgi:hypothetical protein
MPEKTHESWHRHIQVVESLDGDGDIHRSGRITEKLRRHFCRRSQTRSVRPDLGLSHPDHSGRLHQLGDQKDSIPRHSATLSGHEENSGTFGDENKYEYGRLLSGKHEVTPSSESRFIVSSTTASSLSFGDPLPQSEHCITPKKNPSSLFGLPRRILTRRKIILFTDEKERAR